MVKEMITLLAVCWTIFISKNIISKQQELSADPKAIQQINFLGKKIFDFRFLAGSC